MLPEQIEAFTTVNLYHLEELGGEALPFLMIEGKEVKVFRYHFLNRVFLNGRIPFNQLVADFEFHLPLEKAENFVQWNNRAAPLLMEATHEQMQSILKQVVINADRRHDIVPIVCHTAPAGYQNDNGHVMISVTGQFCVFDPT